MAKKTTLVLQLDVEAPRFGEGFYHVNASLRRPPDDPAWREDPANGYYICDLVFASQGDRTSDHVYSAGVRYQQVYAIDERDAERMLKTLRKIGRGMKKLAETYGYPKDFAGALVHFARVTGATTVRWRDPEAPTADEHGMVEHEITEWRIAGFVNAIVAKYGKPEDRACA